MADLYVQMTYQEYKDMEEAIHAFAESTHISTGGFYHKSIRLPIGGGNCIEFHGPIVKAAENLVTSGLEVIPREGGGA